jgi:16S rRNA (guanine527-N7)-methyltransferase
LTIEIGTKELEAARSIFGERLTLAERFVEHLATSGIERGLLGPRELPRLWDRHVLNCAVVGELIPADARVADVGSGAGLPGLALAIARPDAWFVLIEPLERRVNWLREVTDDLGLNNVEIFRGRAEQAVGKFDVNVVTARAVSALSGLATLTMPLLKGSGVVLAIKGRSAGEEVEKAAKVIRRLGGKSTTVETAGSTLLDEPTTVVRIVVAR